MKPNDAEGGAVGLERVVGRDCEQCGCNTQMCRCDDYDEGFDCPHCDDGTLLVCCDDLCHGQGWCMHGDGEVICPHCNGSGVLRPNDSAQAPERSAAK